MIEVKDIHHVALVVRDLEKCTRFYSEVLGLKSLERPPFDFPGHWYLVGPMRQLHLMVFEEKIPVTMRHFAIEVGDFEVAMKELKLRSIEIVDGPGKRVDGSDYLFCKDPDGNLIEITRH
jgi:glyoxylase I family protein